MNNFKACILRLRYEKDTSIYPGNWKYIVPDLADIAANKDMPSDWFFGLSQLESGMMHSVCPVCNDVPLFKWLRGLYDSFVNGTDAPKMPSCADCRAAESEDDE
jgi:hypothetical protein